MNGTVGAYLGTPPPLGTPPWAASRAGTGAAGVTVLIPTYTAADGNRTASLGICIRSALAAARTSDIPLAFLVVDNGLSQAACRQADELLRASGRTYNVLRTAAGPADRRYTAARARNAGLAFLAGLPAGSPLVQGFLLFLDDDTALAPDSLTRLRATLTSRPGVMGACPNVIPVPDTARWLATVKTAGTMAGRAGDGEPRRLASPLREAAYDLLSVTSHGSLVTGRTVGLLVRTAPVLSWVRVHGSLFYEATPYGSSEDILVMALLSRLGELWRVPGAMVADEARKTPGSTLMQQFAWGYDHAWLARALGEANLLDPGIHVLSWCSTGWEHTRADWGPHTGFLINPTELRLGLRLLRALTADRCASAGLFGSVSRQVAAGTRLLGKVLARWQTDPVPASRQHRTDLPPLGSRDWASMRGGMDALVGHLAGNAAGSVSNSAGRGMLPPFFLYGARQPAAPEFAVPGAAEPSFAHPGHA
jgi:hypothetical protein